MASKPPIISGNQPHTVSLPEGSSVAARKSIRKATPAPDLPVVPPRDAQSTPKTAPAPARAAPRAPAKAAPRAERRRAAPAPEPVGEQVGFGADIMARLEGLKQRNDQVRAALDRLPATAGMKR